MDFFQSYVKMYIKKKHIFSWKRHFSEKKMIMAAFDHRALKRHKKILNNVQEVSSPLFQKQPPYPTSSFFKGVYEPPGLDQQNDKWLYCPTPSCPSDHIFSASPSFALYLSPEFLPNFLSNLYIPIWLGKIFKFLVFKGLKMHLTTDVFIIPNTFSYYRY